MSEPDPEPDPVRRRRARIARVVGVSLRVGAALFAVAVLGFFVGLVTDFSGAVAALVVACLVVGSAVLAPAIVFSYAVRAAEREDRAQGR